MAVDCAGGVYHSEGAQLHRMDTAGRLLATVPAVDVATSSRLALGGLAWDASRGLLWAKANDEIFIVEVDPGACGSRDPLPGDLGNTLRAVRAGGDVALSWGSDPVAQSYALHRTTARGAWPTPPALLGLPAPAAQLADVPAPPPLYLYRATGATCAGLGP